MEQIYMIEIFVDTVTMFDEGASEKADTKKLIVTVKFGPKTDFVIKEGGLAKDYDVRESSGTDDETGKDTVIRTIRSGKAYLFPSYPDTIIQILDKFPLEISVWTDEEDEANEFVGVGQMIWDTKFYNMLRENTDPCVMSQPLSIKQTTRLMNECCCGSVGSIVFILRLSALGSSIMTSFQEAYEDNEEFAFTTDRSASVYTVRKVEGDDPNFLPIGNLYQSGNIFNDLRQDEENEEVVCVPGDSCLTDDTPVPLCTKAKPEPIKTVKMGDIKGPCGNANCGLANKIKTFLRNTEEYRKKAANLFDDPDAPAPTNNKLCGQCDCHDDIMHRESCPESFQNKEVTTCEGDEEGNNCPFKEQYHVQVSYPKNIWNSQRERKIVQRTENVTNNSVKDSGQSTVTEGSLRSCRSCNRHSSNNRNVAFDQMMYNVQVNFPSIGKAGESSIMPDGDDCSCDKANLFEGISCGAPNCACSEEVADMLTRKNHRPYCPSYKHKSTCPVSRMTDISEAVEEGEDKEDELPYSLPPVVLAPCPVPGRPCSNPEAFEKLAKALKDPMTMPMPPSYSEAGKICCSKEFERIKKFLNEFMKDDTKDDYRCWNAMEQSCTRRCCDKDQVFGKLAGKDCCGKHKEEGFPSNK